MKVVASLLIFLLSFSYVSDQNTSRGLTITHLTGDFYVYINYGISDGTRFPANSMYMLTSNGAVLFDTPWDSAQFQPLLDSIRIKHGQDVVMCISTHFHEDRTAGLEYYRSKGIKTYTTVLTDSLSKRNNKKRAEYLMYKDTVFKVGQHVFQTYYGGPGHSPDNIVIWFDKEKILYGGCLIKSTEANDLGNLSDVNVKAWSATIKNIQNKFINPVYVIPGHFDWHNNKSLNHTLDLIQVYEEKNPK